MNSFDTESARIVDALRAKPNRDIYESGTPPHQFWITYRGGGPFSRDVVVKMLETGVLTPKYPKGNCFVLSQAAPERRYGQHYRGTGVYTPKGGATMDVIVEAICEDGCCTLLLTDGEKRRVLLTSLDQFKPVNP